MLNRFCVESKTYREETCGGTWETRSIEWFRLKWGSVGSWPWGASMTRLRMRRPEWSRRPTGGGRMTCGILYAWMNSIGYRIKWRIWISTLEIDRGACRAITVLEKLSNDRNLNSRIYGKIWAEKFEIWISESEICRKKLNHDHKGRYPRHHLHKSRTLWG